MGQKKLKLFVFKTPASLDMDISSGLEYESSMYNAIGGFVIVFSTDGDITYISENVTNHLGLAQYEVMGQSIYEFSHPCDHADIKELLMVNRNGDDSPYQSGLFRLKCTLTSRGRSVHLRSASYKVINCTGRLFTGNANKASYNSYVGICEPLPHPSDVDIPLNKQTFLSRHNPDMTCEYIDESVESFLRYKPEDLVGKSIFKFHHAADSHIVGKSYKSLYTKGQTQTDRYRFLAKHGGWIWVVTQATILNATNSLKPSAIVCLHFVTSEIENEEEILSDVQTSTEASIKMVTPNHARPCKKKLRKPGAETEKENLVPSITISSGLSSPTASTNKIFAPRTDDMDSGFLMPSDKDTTQFFSKNDEPEDLTHLAPIAGDDCVSLSVPLLDDLLKSFDQSQLEFTMNGFMLDVNAEEFPSLLNPGIISPGTLGLSESVFNEDSTSQLYKSPLFLNSDPLMGLSTGDSKQTKESKTDFDGAFAFASQSTREHNPKQKQMYQNSTLLTNTSSSMEFSTSNWIYCEELSEISKSCITGNDESEDLPTFDSNTVLVWPCDVNDSRNPLTASRISNFKKVSNTVQMNADSEHSTNFIAPASKNDLPLLDHKRKVVRPCIDIDKGNNTKLKMDILSILSERRPGDFPKVVTSLIFGEPEPPVKLKRTGFLYPHAKADKILHSNSLVGPSKNIPKITTSVKTSNSSCIQRTNTVHGLLIRYGEYNNVESEDDKIDQLHNYPLQQPHWVVRKRNSLGRLLGQDTFQTTSLSELTRQDYEVNAPLEGSCLLQGHDLLTALDTESSNDSVAVS